MRACVCVCGCGCRCKGGRGGGEGDRQRPINRHTDRQSKTVSSHIMKYSGEIESMFLGCNVSNACVLQVCCCICSAQLSTCSTDKIYGNDKITVIIVIIIVILLVVISIYTDSN